MAVRASAADGVPRACAGRGLTPRRVSRGGRWCARSSARRSSAASSGLRHCTSDAPGGQHGEQPVAQAVGRVPVQGGQHAVARRDRPSAPARARAAASTSATVAPVERGGVSGTGAHGTNSSPCSRTSVAKSITPGGQARAGPCRTRRATAPPRRPRARRPARGRPGRRRRAPSRRRPGSVTTSAPHHHAASSTAAVCQCAGSSTATRRARLDVALVAQQVGRLRGPVRGGGAGQLDALAGRVVVERDQRAGGGGAGAQRVEQGGGERHSAHRMRTSVDAGHARRRDRIGRRRGGVGRWASARRLARAAGTTAGSKSAPEHHVQVPAGDGSVALDVDAAQLLGHRLRGVAVRAGVAHHRGRRWPAALSTRAAREAQVAQVARPPRRPTRPSSEPLRTSTT